MYEISLPQFRALKLPFYGEGINSLSPEYGGDVNIVFSHVGGVMKNGLFKHRGNHLTLHICIFLRGYLFVMRRFNFILMVCMAGFFAAGCTTITNLTPSQLPRDPNNMYRVEAAWKTHQQTIRENTIKAFVMIGPNFYPMERTPLMTNRWEGLIPVPPDQDSVYYRFKFEYMVNAIPSPYPDSKLSPEYKLKIVDQKK